MSSPAVTTTSVAAGLPPRPGADGAAAASLPAPAATEDALRGALQGAGLRATRPRMAVLGVLRTASGQHLTAADVAEAARELLGHVSTQAAYDCLDALVRGGLARRFEPAGSPTRYEARVGDNHHHLVCRACGGTWDVDCTTGASPCLVPHLPGPEGPAAAGGFVVDEAEVTFWGLCAPCAAPHQRSTAASSTGTTAASDVLHPHDPKETA